MSSADEATGEPAPVDPEQEEDTGLTGGGGPAAVIYGDGDADEADEIADEMLKGPDDNS